MKKGVSVFFVLIYSFTIYHHSICVFNIYLPRITFSFIHSGSVQSVLTNIPIEIEKICSPYPVDCCQEIRS